MSRTAYGPLAIGVGLMLMLAACEEGEVTNPFQSAGDAGSTTIVERDVEAPEVFQVTDSGLWDGRPSLGGVWVAHSDAKDPERVIIRNETNDKFVIGALFRRERENPGPAIQVSSDAAAALGLVAGQPTVLNVTALRKETVEPEPSLDEIPATEFTEGEDITEGTLEPAAVAAAAIDEAEAAAAPAPEPKPAAAPAKSSLDKPYIQIGIFSVEKNAQNTGAALRSAGVVPTIKKQSSNGKTFWRVIVGPARTADERSQLLKIVKDLGFSDAYYVTN